MTKSINMCSHRVAILEEDEKAAAKADEEIYAWTCHYGHCDPLDTARTRAVDRCAGPLVPRDVGGQQQPGTLTRLQPTGQNPDWGLSSL